MKVLCFDPIVGASGDMILSALIDAGVPVSFLKQKLRFVPGTTLSASTVKKQGVRARQVHFEIKRKIKEKQFIPLINRSGLSNKIKHQAIDIISRIFEVEKKIHGAKNLHLHELADADTLLDITGALVAIDYLQIDTILTRPLKAGQGFIQTAEGTMPSFNFATSHLLKGFPIEFLPIAAELTTPTAAAIISACARPVSCFSLSKLTAIGIGAGSMTFDGYPNLLRVFIGEDKGVLYDTCTVIETNVDDMNPQDYESLFEELYGKGALEVYLTPVIMKHSRPGITLTVLCQHSHLSVVDTLFKHTTTLGVRVTQAERIKLSRQIISCKTQYGRVRVKCFSYKGEERFSLEYQDLKRIAHKQGKSVSSIRAEITEFVKHHCLSSRKK
jgi:uncharacterized protein (TIGR00299 family) protein